MKMATRSEKRRMIMGKQAPAMAALVIPIKMRIFSHGFVNKNWKKKKKLLEFLW